jgi:hypothetical protein
MASPCVEVDGAQLSLPTMEPRPSLRPLAPLIGVLAALWLVTAGMIAAQLLAS